MAGAAQSPLEREVETRLLRALRSRLALSEPEDRGESHLPQATELERGPGGPKLTLPLPLLFPPSRASSKAPATPLLQGSCHSDQESPLPPWPLLSSAVPTHRQTRSVTAACPPRATHSEITASFLNLDGGSGR